MKNMPVALFSNRAKAKPIQQRLVQAGFHAEINEKPGLAMLWFIEKTGPVRVEVPPEEYNRAEQLLVDADKSDGALAQAIHCPECGSLRVDYPQYARHSFLTNVAAGILAQLRLIEKEYY